MAAPAGSQHTLAARATLSTAIELYRAMQMTLWLPQAEAALAQVPPGTGLATAR